MYNFTRINIFYISRLFFIIYFYAPQFVYSASQGEIRIVFDSLSNPYGVTSDNKCCNGETRDTLTSKCSTPCRMQVRFCATPGDFYPIKQCVMGSLTSKTFQGNEISFELPDTKEPIYENYGQVSNTSLKAASVEKVDAMVFRIDHALREEVYFQLLIEILHVPDKPEAKPEVISEYTTSIPFKPHEIWHKIETNNKHGPNLKYSLQVKCDKDHGGSSCAYSCIPRDKWDGHFECDENKQLVCHAGFTGQFCNIAICDPACEDGENGHCLSPYECSCRQGWKGYSCNECVMGPGCVHGTCEKPYECSCTDGWSGGICDTCVKAPECVHGTCNLPFECNCEIGWTGENCDQKVTCDMKPCENGALCLQHSSNYTCVCPKGLAGIHCDIDILDHCDPFPCTKATAICLDKPFGYECSCPLGWGGVNCTERDMCSLNPCINSHECNNIGRDYYCSCKHGWTGKNCTLNSNDCHGQCQNNATCIDKVSEYLCECQPGFSGKNCEININECTTSPCQNRGVCKDEVNGYKCVCQTGFSAKNCSLVFDQCSETPCKNDGLCTRFHNDYKCKCTQNWYGRNCELPTHSVSHLQECKNDPCRHGSTCYMQADKEKCHCTAGYTGRYCQIDIDECLKHKCHNSAQCIDRVNSYECVCPPGFNGKYCQNNINECKTNPCQNGGNCTDGINGFTCQCPTAYQGHDCSYNINDCKNIVCENGGTCLDGINKYSCKCAKGLMGRFCEIEANKCLNQSCAHGKCLRQKGGYACVCNLGYTGEFCDEEINECLGITCHNGGKCIDKIGQYECNCSKELYGPNCQHINACTTNPCQNKGVCFNEGDGYQCKCQSGFFGKNCEKAEDSCMVATYNSTTKGSSLVSRGICGKHGKCISLSANEFKCQCEEGWTGDSCSTNINYCQGNLCRNSGTCLQINGGYICKCGVGFSGKYCKLSIRKCDQRPCDNSGFCIDLPNDFNCSCINGWKGKTCNSRSNNCENSPCLNKGNCTDLGNHFHCQCPEGFVGPTCAEPKDLCKTISCLNGGTCLSSNESFACLCPIGYTGTNCEEDIDYCASDPCKNQGACQDGIGSYHCVCQTGFVGLDCQYPVDQCNPNPCAEGSTCQNVAGSYRCACPEGKHGPKCNNIKLQTCTHQNETFYDNEIWKSDCNKCRCKNGKVTCNVVKCGPTNCFKERYVNCLCREKPNVDCITPPCPKWGECVTYKTSSIHKGGCKPVLKDPSLSKDCSTLNIKFEKALLPSGILVEEICEEFRYSDVLQDPLLKREIILKCQRFTKNANQNELVISVYAKDRAVDVSVILAEFYKYETERGSVLNKLNRTTTKSYVRRHSVVKFRPPDRLNLMVPIMTGLVVLSLMVLFAVCVYYNFRRRSQQALNSEVFFTQKQNEFPTKGQFSIKENKLCKSTKHEYSENDKQEDSKGNHYKKPYNKSVPSSGRLSTINEFVPDKLYMSDGTNNKFSHC